MTTRIPTDPYQNLLSEKGGRGFPHLVFMDFEGNVLATQGARSLQAFEATARSLPAPKPAAEILALEKSFAEGKAALEQGDHPAAIALFRTVLESRLEHAVKDQARQEMGKIEMIAGERLGKAAQLVPTDPVAAHLAYSEIVRDFAGSEVAAEAARHQAAIEAAPEYKAILAKREGELRNARWLDEAKEHLAASRWFEAHEILSKIVESGHPGAALDAARALRAEVEADPARMKAVREAQAESEVKRVMTMARNYALNGANAKAIEKLEDVAERFDGTEWAKKARLMVDQIRRGEIK